LKGAFSDEKVFSVDISGSDPQTSRILNSLEESDNPIRAVVATEKLNEGWDVLNLFDIVRLYDSRDASRNKAGKNTILEAQLIGRGARYWPFTWTDGSVSSTRRFDEDVDLAEYQIIERLTYHSMRNPRYIQELEQALIQQGLLAEKMIQRELVLKPDIKFSTTWQNISIYANSVEKIDDDAPDLLGIGLPARCRFIEISLPSFEITEREIFGDSREVETTYNYIVKEFSGSDFDSRFWLAALDRNQLGTFDSLAFLLPNLGSRKDFIESNLYIAGLSLKIHGLENDLIELSDRVQFAIALKVTNEVLARLSKVKHVGRGSNLFVLNSAEALFNETKVLNFDPENPRARGSLDIAFNSLNWFAQNEIWGTSEEYELISFIDSQKDQIRNNWDYFIVIRNEGQVSIYDFDSGQKFNPDFVMLLIRKSETGVQEVRQVFIEPKGSQFLDASGVFAGGQEGWKEFFLLSLREKAVISEDILVSTSIHGLPFFCSATGHESLLERFVQAFKELITI
jgi:type III restriction enzyme